MTGGAAHRVLGLWLRTAPGARPEPLDALEVETDGGVVGDHRFGKKRHITLVFRQDWRAAEEELGRDVDPVGRRANVLLSGGGCAALVGRVVHLGDVEVEIRDFTRPCEQMNEAAEGLMEALRPDGRAGVWGRILRGGMVRIGDTLTTSPSDSRDVRESA